MLTYLISVGNKEPQVANMIPSQNAHSSTNYLGSSECTAKMEPFDTQTWK